VIVVAVNGRATEISDDATIAGVLAQLNVPGGGRGVAVAVRGEVVPRAEWVRMTLRDGDRIEVVAAIQGG
jgi:sulfur carrier protein